MRHSIQRYEYLLFNSSHLYSHFYFTLPRRHIFYNFFQGRFPVIKDKKIVHINFILPSRHQRIISNGNERNNMAAELLLIRFPAYAMTLILYSYLYLDLEGKMAASLFRHTLTTSIIRAQIL